MRDFLLRLYTLVELSVMAWLLRFKGLNGALVRCRKSLRANRAHSVTLAEVQNAYAVVDRICKWYPPAECLHRSVIGYVVLRRVGMDPTLIIGIRKFPFGAHAWLEYRSVVISDDQDVQLQFIPSIRLGGDSVQA